MHMPSKSIGSLKSVHDKRTSEMLSKYCHTESEADTDSTKESDFKIDSGRRNSLGARASPLLALQRSPSSSALKVIMNNTIKSVAKYRNRVFKNKKIRPRVKKYLPKMPKIR
mmetsp:Transcript_21809/g.19342  ORF Transcript_21809/g.19342 Transcript_21809/m.19342 type:complete len:112 (+) Transcript_21809:493-828(+)